jgi:hypothetical protein
MDEKHVKLLAITLECFVQMEAEIAEGRKELAGMLG